MNDNCDDLDIKTNSKRIIKLIVQRLDILFLTSCLLNKNYVENHYVCIS